MNNKQPLTKKQKEFLKVFDGVAGNVSMACRQTGIKSRTTFYRWMENDEFKDAVENVNESFIDLAESQLRSAVASGNLNAVFFLLKTKGKSRGYTETVEQNVNINSFEQLMKDFAKEED